MAMLVWGCALSMGRTTGGAQSPADGQVQRIRMRIRSGSTARLASTVPGTMSLVESRALVAVRATSGVTLLLRGTTALLSRKSSKKQELNPDSHATESATGCLPATSSVRQRWPLGGQVLGGITAHRAR